MLNASDEPFSVSHTNKPKTNLVKVTPSARPVPEPTGVFHTLFCKLLLKQSFAGRCPLSAN